MPTLLEIQNAIRRGLVARDNAAAAAEILADGLRPEARLDIYRNGFVATLTAALRLSFPAVCRLVGDEFFDGAAHRFIAAEPPAGAYLNDYGEAFPGFLARFAPAATLAYLADVAGLEWAVNRALHAPDRNALELARLAEIGPLEEGRIAFVPHPSIGLVRSTYPVDKIWRAVLDADDAALAKIDLASEPVWLLVERREGRIDVTRCTAEAWRFAAALFSGKPLQSAIDAAFALDPSILLADHLARGRLIDFRTLDRNAADSLEVSL